MGGHLYALSQKSSVPQFWLINSTSTWLVINLPELEDKSSLTMFAQYWFEFLPLLMLLPSVLMQVILLSRFDLTAHV